MNSVSIIIRTLNEKENLMHLLKFLDSQKFKGEKEIIVVDNESTDGTLDVAKEAGAKVIVIKRDEFSYPKSMNMGVDAAKNPIVILTVGHAFPVNKNWISSAAKHFSDPKVAGVYSPVIPQKKHSLSETILYWPGYISAKIKSPFSVKKSGVGVFGATNIALRRSVWEENKFDEGYEMGGEDTKWAKDILAKGYKIICDTDFTVIHSHNLNFRGVIQQIKYWNKLNKPTKFSKKEFDFRKDLKF